MEEAKKVIKRMYLIDNRKFEDDVVDLVLDKENQVDPRLSDPLP